VRLGGIIRGTVVRINGDKVRLGIEASTEAPVNRQAVHDCIQGATGKQRVNG
jgi:sRNA-binding carbon storage regulator CsrA